MDASYSSAGVTAHRAFIESAQGSGTVYSVSTQVDIDPTRPLPVPRRDVDELKLDLDTHGYCFVESAISPAERNALRHKLAAQIEAEHQAGFGSSSARGHKSASNLLNKGKAFHALVEHDLVEELLTHVIGDGYLVSTMDAIVGQPGTLAQGLHIDQFTFALPTDVALVANATWMLDDFTEANGATRVIPGSHRWSPDDVQRVYEGVGIASGGGENPPGTLAAAAPAGTCMVFDGRLVHGGGKNLSIDQERAAVLSLNCRGWIRPFENPFLSISDTVLSEMSAKTRSHLGYEPWGLCGGYQTPGFPPPAGTAKPGDQVGELV